MLKKRLIPVLFLKNGLIVRSQGFEDFRDFGNPINQLQRLNDWRADELIYIDITREGAHDLRRSDHKVKVDPGILDILGQISKQCFMPLTFGGRVSSLEQASLLVQHGADKVVVNTAVYRDPSLIGRIAGRFGSQCMVLGIDVKRVEGRFRVVVEQGSEITDADPIDWARRGIEAGAGEIFLNSIDRDGTADGYELELIDAIAGAVNVPVIACGGAGSFDDFVEVMQKTRASAVAAGNIFNFTENAYPRAKRHLLAANCPVKP